MTPTEKIHRPYSRRAFAGVVGSAAITLAVTACGGGGDPLAQDKPTPAGTADATDAIVIGSQQYYSNEIIAELFAQIIEHAGRPVKRELRIGQREVYMKEITAGKIDVFPEYSGNLLQYLDKKATAKDPDAIQAALGTALPDGLRVLPAAAASDQDSYNVTAEFAQDHGLASLADLAKITTPLAIAANSEFETRPYGPSGLETVYGVKNASVTPVEDSGGPLTVKALLDGEVQLADIYSADPAIGKNSLVTLKDPKHLILPQNIIPLVSKKIDDKLAAAIKSVTDALTTDELIQMNTASVDKQRKADVIAREWLASKGLTA
ncbi:ABC transporter substrate-binding protein [Devriesea agamarum]|uniref:ABC transporter substrate-binding protein n=1 Tax=Devriesea agamarum TaxID=472569 RepID=UPI00071C8B6F|nr:ABC transporter substrate-binding protein [Devriesea agamarum]